MRETGTVKTPGSFVGDRAIGVGLMERPAYRGGWRDGRFEPSGTIPVEERDLSGLEELDQVAYRRGYRDGRRVRGMLRQR